jgi:FtsP/CotA-like multicopper oxidase with cupredoxin domain
VKGRRVPKRICARLSLFRQIRGTTAHTRRIQHVAYRLAPVHAAGYTTAMLSRRHLLAGPVCALADLLANPARRAHAQSKPQSPPPVAREVTELRAGKDGINGAVPGPVVRAPRGGEVRVRFVNGLDEPAALCWHGVRAAGAVDASTAAPGASIEYRFTVPDAGTFWYRAARLAQQEAGLYGALIVEETTPPPVDQDHVLVFDSRPRDRNKDRNKADSHKADGDGGTQCTVNGAAALDISVRANERLRLRFINASAAQPMEARVENHRVLVMALDGEPAEPFESREGAIMLGPGNRADVFVDATLRPGSVAAVTFMMMNAEAPTLRLVYADAPARAEPPGTPAPLPANPLPAQMNFSRALRVTLPIESGGATPLGTQKTLPAPAGLSPSATPQPFFIADRGRTVVMAIENRDAGVHVVHVHGHHFRLLDRLDDGWKPYWLDTLPVAPQQTVRVAFVADAPGRWRIENRILGGAAMSERWFEVR